MTAVSVGLLSRELTRQKKSRTMWRAVMEVLDHQKDLDLLICAGFTLSTYLQLRRVVEHSRTSKTLIVCELNRNGNKAIKPKKKGKKGVRLYWVHRGEKTRVAPQAFSDSSSSRREAENAVNAWHDRLNRQPTKSPRMLWINCGELFVFKNEEGKQRPLARFKTVRSEVKKLLRDTKIVINPMHDRMPRLRHNDGIGRKLSGVESGPIAYVRVSNWNAAKKRKQKRNIKLLHKVYVAGKDQPLSDEALFKDSTEYLFSKINIPLD